MKKYNHHYTLLIVLIFGLINLCVAQQPDTIKVYYNTNKFNLSEEETIKVNHLDSNTIANISIFGFCDDKGSNKTNEILSSKRANNIKNLLLNLNFKSNLIKETKGKGELPLRNYKNKEFERKVNRRAEIIITYNSKKKNDLANVSQEAQIVTNTKQQKPTNLTKNLKKGDQIVLENILFQGGRSSLLPESYNALKKLYLFLHDNVNYKIDILGNICCNVPGQDGLDLNTGKENLSVVRAKTIYDYLIHKGIKSKRMSYRGLKANYPTGKGAKYDRRVEIKIIDN